MRYLQFVTKAAAALMQAIRYAILAVIGAFCRLLGMAPPSTPQLPQASTTPDDVRDEYRKAYAAEVADNLYVGNLGQAVHQYASATDPAVRCAIDLGGLSPAQMDWLLGLADEDLQRLAAAGPKACALAVSGKRSGIVGLSAPSAAAPEIEVPHPTRNLLADRIRTTQGEAGLGHLPSSIMPSCANDQCRPAAGPMHGAI